MYLSTVEDWLAYISSIHVSEIDLGLDRVKKVAAKLNVLNFPHPVILVGERMAKAQQLLA